MNFTDEPVLLWASNFTEDQNSYNTTSLDMRALETFLVMPVSAAGKAVGESVVEVIDEAITALMVVVMVLIAVVLVGGTALVVALVRRRRRRLLAARAAEEQAGQAVEGETALEMAELGQVPGTPAPVEPALDDGESCKKVPLQPDNSQPK